MEVLLFEFRPSLDNTMCVIVNELSMYMYMYL